MSSPWSRGLFVGQSAAVCRSPNLACCCCTNAGPLHRTGGTLASLPRVSLSSPSTFALLQRACLEVHAAKREVSYDSALKYIKRHDIAKLDRCGLCVAMLLPCC